MEFMSRRLLRVFSVSFSHKNVIKKLTTKSKNHAVSQKVLEDWLRLPERQELFAGLILTVLTFFYDPCDQFDHPASYSNYAVDYP